MVIENGFKEIAISEAPAGCILYTRVVSAKNLKLCTVKLANQSELSSDVSRSEIESARKVFARAVRKRPLRVFSIISLM